MGANCARTMLQNAVESISHLALIPQRRSCNVLHHLNFTLARHEWFQTPESVTVTFFCKERQESDVCVEYTSNSVCHA